MLDQAYSLPLRKAEAGAAERLALFVFCIAAEEPVRTLEAIAAVVANQAAQSLAKEQPGVLLSDLPRQRREGIFLSHLLPVDEEAHQFPSLSNERFAACLRIARRAVAGALRDPTGGATRFHPIGASPGWAERWFPTAWIGNFLFYREK
ncbi:MAG: cell wall hydrolase [Rhodospirillales bacterium]